MDAKARRGRLAEAPEADGLLSATIISDVDPQVRATAILAAALVESLRHAARGDEADSVRRDAINLLRERPNAAPGIPDTLAWVAEHDTKSGVRRLDQEALASVSREPNR